MWIRKSPIRTPIIEIAKEQLPGFSTIYPFPVDFAIQELSNMRIVDVAIWHPALQKVRKTGRSHIMMR